MAPPESAEREYGPHDAVAGSAIRAVRATAFRAIVLSGRQAPAARGRYADNYRWPRSTKRRLVAADAMGTTNICRRPAAVTT